MIWRPSSPGWTIVRNYDDDEAAIIVADGNLHRDGEEISLMERAFNLRMKYDARQRKMGRKAGGEQAKGRGDTDFAKDEGLSRTKLHQIMRLTELIPQLQDMVTEGTRLKSFNTIYELACLKPAEQTMVYAQIKQSGRVPTLEEVKAIRRGEAPDKPKAPAAPEPTHTPEPSTPTPPALRPVT